MTDYIKNSSEKFEYSYSAKSNEEIEQIKKKYLPKKETKMEQLIRLDKQTEKPGMIASIGIGIIGSLLLGVGMCCTIVWNTNILIFIAGIIIGLMGLALVGAAYPIYKKITQKEREKVAEQIIAISNELMC